MASFVNSVRQAAVATKDAYEKFERGRQWVQQKQQLVEHKAQVTAPGEDQFDQIVDAAHTAIVKIIALDSRASGFFVSEDGYVLSSHEVGTWVAKGDALAQTHDGDIGKLTRIADYPDLDYALLKLDIRPLRSSWLRPDFLGVYPGKSVVLAGFNHQAGHYEPAFTSAHVSSSDDISCSLCSVVVDPGVYGGPVLGSPVGHYCGIIHGASRQDKAPEGQIAFTPLVSTTYPVDADIMKHRQLNPAERTCE